MVERSRERTSRTLRAVQRAHPTHGRASVSAAEQPHGYALAAPAAAASPTPVGAVVQLARARATRAAALYATGELARARARDSALSPDRSLCGSADRALSPAPSRRSSAAAGGGATTAGGAKVSGSAASERRRPEPPQSVAAHACSTGSCDVSAAVPRMCTTASAPPGTGLIPARTVSVSAYARRTRAQRDMRDRVRRGTRR